MITVSWHLEEMTTEYEIANLIIYLNYPTALFFFSSALKLTQFISLQLFVWNQHSTQPVLKYCEHTAAVKAIAWSPHLHGLLASGGGTADRCIRFWNTTTNSHLSCMDTGSQV
jgi:WD40 repeat protein